MLWFLEDCKRKTDITTWYSSYTGADGKRKQPWHATGLPVKGNKKRAEEMLRELRRGFHAAQARAGHRPEP